MLTKNTIKTMIKILETKKEYLDERCKVLITMYTDLGLEEENFNEDMKFIIDEKEMTKKLIEYWNNRLDENKEEEE